MMMDADTEDDGRGPAFADGLLLFAHADSDSDGGGVCEESMATSSPCRGCSQVAAAGEASAPPPLLLLPHSRAASQGHRLRVCQEIVASELKYCRCLRTAIDLAESIKAAACVSLKNLCLIFPKSLPRLHELHSAFLARLELRLRSEPPAAADAGDADAEAATFSAVVADFLRANEGELFAQYLAYANDFGRAARALHKCQQRSARLRRLLHCLQRHPACEGLDVAAFLLTPVQRPPRYLLLMRQLQAHTPPGHPDQASLAAALASLRGLLDGLNLSIHAALRHQQQQQQAVRPCGGGSAASCESLQLLGRLTARRRGSCDVLEAASSASTETAAGACHFLGAGRRRDTQPDLPVVVRCRSVPRRVRDDPPGPAAAPAAGGQAVMMLMMGPRSRAISRQLRAADRCHSAGDILRPPLQRRRPPAATVAVDGGINGGGVHAPLAAADEDPFWGHVTMRGGARRRNQSAATTSRSTLRESLKKMFLPRRKSSVSDIDRVPQDSSAATEGGKFSHSMG